MRELRCSCGKLVAKLEKGSLIKSGTVFTCSDCNGNDDLYEKVQKMREKKKRDNFNVFNDTLKNRGYDIGDMFK